MGREKRYIALILASFSIATMAIAGQRITGDLQVTGNATVDGYIYGDGSLLSNLPSPDLFLYAQKTEAFLLDQSIPQEITGLSDGYLKLTAGVIGTGAIDVSGLVAKTDAQTIKVDGDFYGQYLLTAVKKISPPDLGYGYAITRVVVQCASADPVTEFRGDLKRSDAQGTGSFPGANPVVIKVLDSTTGNYDSGVIAENVASGSELYIQMDSNVDYGVTWTITVTYQLRTS